MPQSISKQDDEVPEQNWAGVFRAHLQKLSSYAWAPPMKVDIIWYPPSAVHQPPAAKDDDGKASFSWWVQLVDQTSSVGQPDRSILPSAA